MRFIRFLDKSIIRREKKIDREKELFFRIEKRHVFVYSSILDNDLI